MSNIEFLDLVNLILVNPATAWIATIAAIWKFSKKVETANVVSSRGRDSTIQWLLSIKPEKRIRLWADSFLNAFDSVFGHKHFTWKCMDRSWLASLITVLLLCLILLPYSSPSFSNISKPKTWIIVPFWLAVNLAVDYISLLETRLVLENVRQLKRKRWVLIVLIVDVALTFTLIFAPLHILLFILSAISWLSPDVQTALSITEMSSAILGESAGIFSYVWSIATFQRLDELHGYILTAVVYSTFFTSSWFWLHLIAGFLIQLSERTYRFRKLLTHFLNIEEKPFESIGVVAIICITVIFAVIIPFRTTLI